MNEGTTDESSQSSQESSPTGSSPDQFQSTVAPRQNRRQSSRLAGPIVHSSDSEESPADGGNEDAYLATRQSERKRRRQSRLISSSSGAHRIHEHSAGRSPASEANTGTTSADEPEALHQTSASTTTSGQRRRSPEAPNVDTAGELRASERKKKTVRINVSMDTSTDEAFPRITPAASSDIDTEWADVDIPTASEVAAAAATAAARSASTASATHQPETSTDQVQTSHGHGKQAEEEQRKGSGQVRTASGKIRTASGGSEYSIVARLTQSRRQRLRSVKLDPATIELAEKMGMKLNCGNVTEPKTLTDKECKQMRAAQRGLTASQLDSYSVMMNLRYDEWYKNKGGPKPLPRKVTVEEEQAQKAREKLKAALLSQFTNKKLVPKWLHRDMEFADKMRRLEIEEQLERVPRVLDRPTRTHRGQMAYMTRLAKPVQARKPIRRYDYLLFNPDHIRQINEHREATAKKQQRIAARDKDSGTEPEYTAAEVRQLAFPGRDKDGKTNKDSQTDEEANTTYLGLSMFKSKERVRTLTEFDVFRERARAMDTINDRRENRMKEDRAQRKKKEEKQAKMLYKSMMMGLDKSLWPPEYQRMADEEDARQMERRHQVSSTVRPNTTRATTR
ncbi:uncharacterized protein LOC135813350 [Sycon ciliatum]|uniref:uncharacterized protein LOC135813350 n=1 Tax=Sycon ciliatum TaxID=27933 RepID=UPI0031F6A41B